MSVTRVTQPTFGCVMIRTNHTKPTLGDDDEILEITLLPPSKMSYPEDHTYEKELQEVYFDPGILTAPYLIGHSKVVGELSKKLGGLRRDTYGRLPAAVENNDQTSWKQQLLKALTDPLEKDPHARNVDRFGAKLTTLHQWYNLKLKTLGDFIESSGLMFDYDMVGPTLSFEKVLPLGTVEVAPKQAAKPTKVNKNNPDRPEESSRRFHRTRHDHPHRVQTPTAAAELVEVATPLHTNA